MIDPNANIINLGISNINAHTTKYNFLVNGNFLSCCNDSFTEVEYDLSYG